MIQEIKGFNGELYASDDGKIWNEHLNRFLQQQTNHAGYKQISYAGQNYFVHRLVASCFCPNDDPEHKTSVDHINAIRSNNRASNLMWVTPAFNSFKASIMNHAAIIDINTNEVFDSGNYWLHLFKPNCSYNDLFLYLINNGHKERSIGGTRLKLIKEYKIPY